MHENSMFSHSYMTRLLTETHTPPQPPPHLPPPTLTHLGVEARWELERKGGGSRVEEGDSTLRRCHGQVPAFWDRVREVVLDTREDTCQVRMTDRARESEYTGLTPKTGSVCFGLLAAS